MKNKCKSRDVLFTNRSVIFGVKNHCELSVTCFHLLSQSYAITSETLESLHLFRIVTFIFIFYVTFFKKDIRHNYIDLLTDIYLLRNHKFSDKHVYIHVYQDINMITWQIPFNMVPPSNDCCSNGFRHASFF